MHLEVQISGLQKEGVSRLKQRMKEVSADKAKSNKIRVCCKIIHEQLVLCRCQNLKINVVSTAWYQC